MVKPFVLESLIEERLGYYRKRMIEANASPIICLGITLGTQAARPVLCTVEDMPSVKIVDFLRKVADELEANPQ